MSKFNFKKSLLILFVLAVVPFGLKADPAKKVELSFKDGKLKIVAVHPTKNVNDHYIDQIVIKVDKKDVKELKFNKQSSAEAQEVEVVIPEIKPGTTVEVKTRCNKFGFKSGKLQL